MNLLRTGIPERTDREIIASVQKLRVLVDAVIDGRAI